MMMRQDQAPGSNATGDAGKAIIHARLGIGDTVLIGNDVPPSVFEKIRSVYLYLSVDSSEEAERVYKHLAKVEQVYMQFEETFFATRFSQLRDCFGVSRCLVSLDVLRGLAVAGMILVTDPGTYGAVYSPLLHARGTGLFGYQDGLEREGKAEMVPVPGFGAGRVDSIGNLGAYIDRSLLGTRHMWPWGLTPGYGVTFDPEGLLSTLPAIASLLIGIIAGEWLRADYSKKKKLILFVGTGVVLVLAGWLLSPLLPLNKKDQHILNVQQWDKYTVVRRPLLYRGHQAMERILNLWIMPII